MAGSSVIFFGFFLSGFSFLSLLLVALLSAAFSRGATDSNVGADVGSVVAFTLLLFSAGLVSAACSVNSLVASGSFLAGSRFASVFGGAFFASGCFKSAGFLDSATSVLVSAFLSVGLPASSAFVTGTDLFSAVSVAGALRPWMSMIKRYGFGSR